MTYRENDDRGFFCNEPFCDGDHVSSTERCYTQDEIDTLMDEDDNPGEHDGPDHMCGTCYKWNPMPYPTMSGI